MSLVRKVCCVLVCKVTFQLRYSDFTKSKIRCIRRSEKKKAVRKGFTKKKYKKLSIERKMCLADLEK